MLEGRREKGEGKREKGRGGTSPLAQESPYNRDLKYFWAELALGVLQTACSMAGSVTPEHKARIFARGCPGLSYISAHCFQPQGCRSPHSLQLSPDRKKMKPVGRRLQLVMQSTAPLRENWGRVRGNKSSWVEYHHSMGC